MAKTRLAEEMVEEAIRLKANGFSNGDIICALGVHENTFFRWIGNPRGKLQRSLCEGPKWRRRRSSRRCSRTQRRTRW